MAIVGFFLAIWVDNMIPATEFKHLMGVCLALVLAVMLWSQWKGKENLLIDKWWYSPLFGLLGGFTTLIGNAAVLPFHSLYRALLAKQTNFQDTTLNVR